MPEVVLIDCKLDYPDFNNKRVKGLAGWLIELPRFFMFRMNGMPAVQEQRVGDVQDERYCHLEMVCRKGRMPRAAKANQDDRSR